MCPYVQAWRTGIYLLDALQKVLKTRMIRMLSTVGQQESSKQTGSADQ